MTPGPLSLALLLALPLVALGCKPRERGDGVRLTILKQDWEELHLGYQPGPALAGLAAASLADPLFEVEPDDIAEYRTATETLVLTPAATSRLVQALAQARPRSEGVRDLNALKERLGHADALESALYIRAFVVRVGETRIYGGIFLDPPSQMAIQFPVARVGLEDGKAVFHFLPVHLPFLRTDPGVDASAGGDRPGDVPAVMVDDFRKQGMSPLAVTNRQLIQYPRIRGALRAAGKLR